MVGRALGRMILVPLGLLLAVVVAAVVVTTLGLERLTQELHRTGQATDAGGVLWGLLDGWEILLRLVSAASIVPALLLVIVAEVARVRAAIYYVIGGGVALGVIPVVAHLEASGAFALPPAVLWQIFATAGFVAGFVYWLIAGRSA